MKNKGTPMNTHESVLVLKVITEHGKLIRAHYVTAGLVASDGPHTKRALLGSDASDQEGNQQLDKYHCRPRAQK
jgi:hypothetical protein